MSKRKHPSLEYQVEWATPKSVFGTVREMIDRVVYIQPEVGKEVVSFNSNQSEQLDKNTTVLS